MDQLKALGMYTRDQIQESPELFQRFRHHKLNYNIPNTPINSSHFSWLPKEYYENEEFSIWQFQVSKANGRFLGFYDENNVFQIVHFDPLHNAQPSKDFDYKVDDCHPIGTVYENLVTHIEHQHAICAACCQNMQDEALHNILERHRDPNSPFCPIHIQQDLYQKYIVLKEEYAKKQNLPLPPNEVFSMGIHEAEKFIQ